MGRLKEALYLANVITWEGTKSFLWVESEPEDYFLLDDQGHLASPKKFKKLRRVRGIYADFPLFYSFLNQKPRSIVKLDKGLCNLLTNATNCITDFLNTAGQRGLMERQRHNPILGIYNKIFEGMQTNGTTLSDVEMRHYRYYYIEVFKRLRRLSSELGPPETNPKNRKTVATR